MFEQFRCFSSLAEEHLGRIQAISKHISVQKGAILFAPGDESRGFYAVSSGAVRLYRVSPRSISRKPFLFMRDNVLSFRASA